MKWVKDANLDIDVVKADAVIFEKLRALAEYAKCKLSSESHIKDTTHLRFGTTTISTALSRVQLQKILEPMVKKAILIAVECVKKANITKKDLCTILPVGGSTRLLSVQAALKAEFEIPLSSDLDADTSVSKGAADLAAQIFFEQIPNIIDIAPLGLGVCVADGSVFFLIKSNTTLPAVGEHTFNNHYDYQDRIDITVFEGNRYLATDCSEVGRLMIPVDKKGKKGTQKVKVTFRLDENGTSGCDRDRNARVCAEFCWTHQDVLQCVFPSSVLQGFYLCRAIILWGAASRTN